MAGLREGFGGVAAKAGGCASNENSLGHESLRKLIEKWFA